MARALGLALPVGDVDLEGALELLGGGGDPVTRRQVSLLGVDHWYDSRRLWAMVPTSPGARFSEAFGACAEWYREQVGVVGGGG
ncbi:hypothetical protein [Streptomyces antimicrobicus]|uniref:Uncharacterized protein n=1 Tax=Streptomyces antimicrobicus TaxID=2883108 RepID=A0ABS8B1Z3_9ACTN|nr:hypothetical protein [Streptomyces antimicrobicus]MCB5178592.1 hypothetical protein [Streptomyces antimicrobicus]